VIVGTESDQIHFAWRRSHKVDSFRAEIWGDNLGGTGNLSEIDDRRHFICEKWVHAVSFVV
jgi:hypothetical protein